MKIFTRISFIALLQVICLTGLAQLTVTPNQTATVLAQSLAGTGVTILNPTLNCAGGANAVFTATASNLNLPGGILLTSGNALTGTNIGANGPATLFASTANSYPTDADLNSLLVNQTSQDACILEFDFIPAGDTVKFDYVFGSDEYNTFACSGYNDIFAFFISGPGIVGKKNIALIPGTNIPVAINTINNGSAYSATPSNPCHIATGGVPPFSSLFIDNAAVGGTTVTYNGFTTVLQAVTEVVPCDTFHLKLAIADVGDMSYDSGVFLKAGSLNSNSITIKPQSGGGLSSTIPYCIRGCAPGVFAFKRQVPKPTPLTIHYIIAGTATNGVDYNQIPDSVVIPAFDTIAYRYIYGIPVAPPQGIETVKLKILSPYSCSAAQTIIDSAELNLHDSIYVKILSNDTSICLGESVPLTAVADDSVTLTWSPTATLSTSVGNNTTATPTATTTYTVTASLAQAGCPPSSDNVTVSIRESPIVDVGPDVTTCDGVPIQFTTSVLPSNQNYTYSWSPGTFLNATNIPDPIATASATTTYVVTVNSGAIGCDGFDTVNLIILPNDFTLLNQDTVVCQGAPVQARVIGDPNFTYTWTPSNGVNPQGVPTPSITADSSRYYTITATYPGCPDMVHGFRIDVEPNPIVYLGPDRTMCEFDTLQFYPVITPDFANYAYSWTPPGNVKLPNSRNIYFDGNTDETLVLTVSTPAGCVGTDDVNIIVHPGNFGTLNPVREEICPNTPVQVNATGGVNYAWSPTEYVSDSTINNPILEPITNTTFTVIVTDQYGCQDTLSTEITVNPEGLISLPDSVVLYSGDSYQMDPQGNCLYFNWFPPLGLNFDNIANPTAMPSVNTRYYVTASTEAGCETHDSIDVIIDPHSYIDLPNAFSPGGGVNNNFEIIHRGIVSLNYFRIFNRWGQLVFSTNDVNEGWDGTHKGEPQPMGVYIWQVDAFGPNGKKFIQTGNVTLIR